MRFRHTPSHWALTALVAAALLLTFSEAHGQTGVADTPGAAEAQARKDIKPAPDRGLAKDQRSASRKVAKAAKRTISRAKHGNSPIDSVTNPKTR